MAVQTSEPMVRSSAVAAKLGISDRTVRRYARLKKIPSQRIGKVYLFNPAWLDELTAWPPAETEVA
jgi:excisionase family DNA binding protein